MNIVILGAHGQVGSEIKNQLVAQCREVITRVITAARVDVDITEFDELCDFLDQYQPHWIINATAYTAVDKAETEQAKCYLINEQVVQYLSNYCSIRSTALMHISTDYVFSGFGGKPFSEDDPVLPSSVYGRSKLAGEEAIRKNLKRHLILRTSWVFGSRGSNFVKTMLRLATSRTTVPIVADQYGAPTSARGIARTIAVLVSQMQGAGDSDKRWGTYHYSGYPFLSWAQFAVEIFDKAFALKIISVIPEVTKLATHQYPTPAKRPANSRLDCAKIDQVFGVAPDDWREELGVMLGEMQGVE